MKSVEAPRHGQCWSPEECPAPQECTAEAAVADAEEGLAVVRIVAAAVEW